ncbi:MAG: serine/threonine protein kinase [Acidobacteria bacterium]|nr:MAG: serine/threonine protein kinase [Acidobacteriota bacterium]
MARRMPEQLGHYNLLERVGAGGLGTAFRARDTVLGRTVLVKNAAERVGPDPLVRKRFLKDARAAATVSHPNVATLFEVGDRPDQLFLVFEFVPGKTLDQLQAGRPLDVRRSVDLGVQLAEALGAAHACGVLHLDVRPANIKVSLGGHAKLLDTGLSAWTTRGRAERTAGSVDDRGAGDREDPYRSPEQRRGEPPDHRSDLFSLGVILFEMLTGRVPADGASGGPPTPPRPTAVSTAVPPELDSIVERAMADRVEDRYQSAVSFAAELRSVGAMFDVRSGGREPPSLVTATEARSGRSSRWLIPFLALLALAGATWLWLR